MQFPPYLRQLASARKSLFSQLQVQELGRIEEAMAVPDMSSWSISDASAPRNASRNRYINVFPWNFNRVHLKVLPNYSDYINASHIEIDSSSRYIASQGPMPATIHHFWAMCFQQSELQHNDTIIVAMVTPLVENGMTKCCKYWPDEHEPIMYLTNDLHRDGFTEKLTIEYNSLSWDEEGGFLVSKFTLLTPQKSKTVHHYYYSKWVDSRSPPSARPLVTLSRRIRLLQSTVPNRPIPIIHCSAGVGRTGTYITVDHLLHHVQSVINPENDRDPILDTVTKLRQQRMMMVQTLHQYEFLYDTVKLMVEQIL